MESKPNPVKILGVLITRNQWPLVGLCITHALVNHVDEIIVVDHASTDDTQAGLAALKERWGSKIQVLHLCEGTFHHEETNLLLKSMYENRDFDWVYPIDADEFLITQDNLPLRQLLADVPPMYGVARYELHNFVAPDDFVEDDFDRYSELSRKAIVDSNIHVMYDDIFEAVAQGNVNFFQVPFPSKVMFRLPNNSWAASGSHSILGFSSDAEFKFPDQFTFVAHLPFLTKDRVARRAIHGKNLAAMGYSRNYGWQSQVIDRIMTEGRLNEYWMQNSIPKDQTDTDVTFPPTVLDLRLSSVLQIAVAELTPSLEVMKPNIYINPIRCEPSVTLSEGIHAIRSIGQLKESGIALANSKIEGVTSQLTNSQIENATLRSENLELQSSNTSLRTEIASLRAEKSQFLNSMSWRMTRSVRIVHGFLTKLKK